MRETSVTCNYCKGVIKVERTGGRMPDLVPAIARVPAELYTITNNRGEVFDFCSRECIELGDF